jgi:hypothetical protein
VSRRAPPPEDAPAPIGHNRPPGASLDLTAEQWIAWLATVFSEATKRRANLMASFARFDAGYPISPNSDGEPPHGIEKWSDDVQGRAGDFRDKLQALVKNAEALHSIEKAPVLVAQRAIDGYLRSFREPLDAAIREIRRRQTVYGNWQEDESRRRAREEAERIRAQAEAALSAAAASLDPDDLQQAADAAADASAAARYAEAAPAEHTRVHGELGSVTSLRKQHVFVPEESDLYELAKAVVLHQAPVSYLAFNETRIRVAIRVEHVRDIPGCKIREEAVAR